MQKYEFDADISKNGSILLPKKMSNKIKNHHVKIILFDLGEKIKEAKLTINQSLKGVFNRYSDLSKVQTEKDAFKKAMEKKHENN